MRPTLQDVADYVNKHDYTVNASKFYHYYDRSNWQSRGIPIDNWQALLDSWQKHERAKPVEAPKEAPKVADKPKEAFYDTI